MPRVTPFLWFDDQAEEAVRFYTSVFPISRIVEVSRYTESAPGRTGSVMTVEFELDGQPMIALNGGPHFRFNEAVSFSIDCKSQEEVDYYWEKLTDGGEEVQCGWLKDRYGLSWQVNPGVLDEMLKDPDREKADRVMQAMLRMVKIDIPTLEKAYAG